MRAEFLQKERESWHKRQNGEHGTLWQDVLFPWSSCPHIKEGRKEGTCLFDINIKQNTEIFIGKIISGDSH